MPNGVFFNGLLACAEGSEIIKPEHFGQQEMSRPVSFARRSRHDNGFTATIGSFRIVRDSSRPKCSERNRVTGPIATLFGLGARECALRSNAGFVSVPLAAVLCPA